MRIFQAKHQKLILQCYPPGRGVDKKPNSSELSYLLYYATTRRVKLEKVGIFLEKKNISDVSHSRAGNVQVTLDIIGALIDKCFDNLNVLAAYVVSILSQVFHTKDITLCQHALPIYCLFCEKLNGDLFTGDRDFVDKFTNLTETIIQLGVTAQKPNQEGWRLISLQGARYVANCVAHSAPCGKIIIDKSIPLIIEAIQRNCDENSLLSRIKSINNDESNTRNSSALKKVNTTRNDPAEDSAPTEQDEALKALREYFNTTSVTQLIESTKRLLKYNLKSNMSQNWADSLFQMITNWIPVQLRFIILATLLTQLTDTTGYKDQYCIATYISGLLSSNVNMIGLSVTDVVVQLLTLQEDLITKETKTLNEQQILDLSSIYLDCVTSLSTHIYYYNQIADVVSEILLRVTELYSQNTEKTTPSKQIDSKTSSCIIKVFLEDIRNIFIQMKKRESSVDRNKCTIEIWDMSFNIICQESKSLSKEDSMQIQELYFTLFNQFVVEELEASETSKPDFNHYISQQQNSLSHYFISVDKFFHSINSSADSVLVDKIRVLNLIANAGFLLLDKFGVNFISNSIPFFFHWQLMFEEEGFREFTKAEILRDTFAYSLLYNSSTYIKADNFKDLVASRISYRQTNNIWEKDLDLGIPLLDASTPSAHSTITRKQLQDLVLDKGGILTAWLDPGKPLILDSIENAKQLNNHDSFNHSNSAVDTSMSSSYIDAPDIIVAKSNGIGTIGDINSIHSGLLSAGAGSFLSGKRIHSPKVSELREAISGSNLRPQNNINGNGSIISKRTDAASLLDELTVNEDDDDDRPLAI